MNWKRAVKYFGFTLLLWIATLVGMNAAGARPLELVLGGIVTFAGIFVGSAFVMRRRA